MWELWAQSAELLTVTLGAELVDSADLDPPPKDVKVSFCFFLALKRSVSRKKLSWNRSHLAPVRKACFGYPRA